MAIRRREFVGGAAALLASCERSQADLPTSNMPAGKDAGLRMLSADPLVLETPDKTLAQSTVTPTTAVFVRQHHGAKPFNDLRPASLAGWTIQLSGLVRGPASFAAERLGSLPKTEVEMVLQCSGNNRSEYSKIAPIKGVQWNRGGVANVRFAGPTLKSAFADLGLDVDSQAKYLTVGGADEPEKPGQADFEHSLPLDLVLESSIFALEMNGEPLSKIHGGPVRLVTPGLYATMHIKWVDRLRFDAVETPTYYQMRDYRVPTKRIAPGQAMLFTPTNSEPHQYMNVASRFFSPESGATVPSGVVTLSGVAWNDGRAEIVSVEVSTDAGKSWQRAELESAASPFAWRKWRATVALSAGRQEAWVRAVDALGRSQPLDGRSTWNPGGYGWNAVDRRSFEVV